MAVCHDTTISEDGAGDRNHLTGTLRRDLKRQLPRLYDEARSGPPKKLAPCGEAHVADRFPERCPYTLDQVLGDFWALSRSDQGHTS